MSQCLTCRNAEQCTFPWKDSSEWMNCTGYVRPPETNADRIRTMTDEELVDFIIKVGGNIRAGLTPDGGWLNWLKQEAT